jgi:hypothetical protein
VESVLQNAAADEPSEAAAYQELKSQVHNQLFNLLDLSRIGKLSKAQVREDVATATRRVLEEGKLLLNLEEREQLVREIQDEVFGTSSGKASSRAPSHASRTMRT